MSAFFISSQARYSYTAISLNHLRYFKLIATTPICRISTTAHIPMKRRVFPIYDLINITVFYRIEMQIIQMLIKTHIITDSMLPKSLLPDIWKLISTMILGKTLDLPPPFGIINVIFRQLPNGMQMIGQQHPRHNFKRIFLAHSLNRLAQRLSDFRVGQYGLTLCRHQREVCDTS